MKTGVTLAIDDVFEAWHDDDESDSDSSSDGEEEGEGEEDRRGRRGRYCGILSVPFDFEAPDLGAAVARMMRNSLPPSEETPSSSSSTLAEGPEEDGEEGAFLGFEPSEAGGERVFDVSAPGATAAAGAARAAGRMMLPLPPPLLRGRGRKTQSARRPSPLPARAAVAPRAVASSSAPSSTRSPLLRRLLIL